MAISSRVMISTRAAFPESFACLARRTAGMISSGFSTRSDHHQDIRRQILARHCIELLYWMKKVLVHSDSLSLAVLTLAQKKIGEGFNVSLESIMET
jgi:hypothetical protein